MTRNEIIARLQPIFDDLFMEKVTLTQEVRPADVEEWDSLIHISVLLAVEKDFGVRFGLGEVEATGNVGEFADLIAKKAGG